MQISDLKNRFGTQRVSFGEDVYKRQGLSLQNSWIFPTFRCLISRMWKQDTDLLRWEVLLYRLQTNFLRTRNFINWWRPNRAKHKEEFAMSKIQFRNAAHRDFVLENLDKCKVNDCYHRAFFYVMGISEETRMNIGKTVSYTHLDVYKRQTLWRSLLCPQR